MTTEIRLLRLGGSGPNLLLIHGFGADRSTWLTNQQVLLESCSLFACDLPAHGSQPPLAVEMTISTIADRLIGQLEARGERFLLVGHSLGGAVAIELAARRPDLVSGLALVAPAGLGTRIDRDFLLGFPALLDIESALALLRRLVTRPRLITPHLAQRVIEHLNRSGVRSAMQALADQLLEVETSLKHQIATLARSDIPRLVIWGEDDQINPIDRSKLAKLTTQMITLPNTAHLPHIEGSKAVNGYLIDFMKTSLHDPNCQSATM